MRYVLVSLSMALAVIITPAYAYEAAQGWCENGGQTVTTGANVSSTKVQRSYPPCTITVYVTGTGGLKATVFSDASGTPLSNPFTSGTNGFWQFFSSNGHYDVQLSGGGLPIPTTIGDVLLFDPSVFYAVPVRPLTATGGYVQLQPINYPGSSCLDIYGNIVNVPVKIDGSPVFGVNDTIMWVSQSPLNGVASCASQIPSSGTYSLNINSHMFAVGGYLTANPGIGSFQSIAGGMTAGAFAAHTYYPAGTVTTGGTLSTPAYLGGYVHTGHSNGAPQAGFISSINNPLLTGDALEQGIVYWDDFYQCERVYNGTTWSCLTAGASGADTQIQYNSGGLFAGSSSLTWDQSQRRLIIVGNNAAAPALGVGVGYVLSDKGFQSSSGTGTAFNTFYSPDGGMAAKSFTATAYTQPGRGTVNPTVVSGDTFLSGAMYYNTSDGCIRVYTGSTWVCQMTLNTVQVVSVSKDWQANQRFDSRVQFYNGTSASGASWSMASLIDNILTFIDSSSNSRMFLNASGVGIAGGGIYLSTPSVLVQPTNTGSPAMIIGAFPGNTSDIFQVFSDAFSTKALWVDSAGITHLTIGGHTGGTCSAWVDGICTTP